MDEWRAAGHRRVPGRGAQAFVYVPTWLESPQFRPLSLSLATGATEALLRWKPPEEAWRILDIRPAEPRVTLAVAAAHAATPALQVDLRLDIEHIPRGPDHLLLVLGPEIVRSWRGECSLTIRHPWLVAFLFGLLHGAGWAGGLQQLGLPKGETLQALALFNLGVEIGQLAFLALVLLVVALWRQGRLPTPLWLRWLPGYLVGSLGAYWAIERTVAMVWGS